VDPTRTRADDRDLRPLEAFTLLFILPAVCVALSWLVVSALDPVDGPLLILFVAPALLAGAASRAVGAALDVARSTAWSFALGSGAIAVVLALIALGFVVAGND
jgi:hypothetical protein